MSDTRAEVERYARALPKRILLAIDGSEEAVLVLHGGDESQG